MLATRISGSLTLSQRARFQMNLSIPESASASELCSDLALHLSRLFFFSGGVPCTHLDTLSMYILFGDSSEPTASPFYQVSDVWHLLDPSSISLVIVMVVVKGGSTAPSFPDQSAM